MRWAAERKRLCTERWGGRRGIEWVPLIGGGGEVPFIKRGWRGSFSPWRKKREGIGELLERFF
jgi:hypothetical protein